MKKFKLAIIAMLAGVVFSGSVSLFNNSNANASSPYELPKNAPDFDKDIETTPADDAVFTILGPQDELIWKGKMKDYEENKEKVDKLIQDKKVQLRKQIQDEKEKNNN